MIDLVPVYGKSISASTAEAAIAQAVNGGWRVAQASFPFPDSTWLERGEQRAVLMVNDSGYMLMTVGTVERLKEA